MTILIREKYYITLLKSMKSFSDEEISMKSHLTSNKTLHSVRQVTSNEVNLIAKSLETKNMSGVDTFETCLVC